MLDTGFDGWLELPPRELNRLNAKYKGPQRTKFASGELRRVPSYVVALEWNGETILVEALEIDGNPLLGTQALRGNLVQIEMTDGGDVSVEPLS